ncbi:unnamed protein product [Ilex paraguariensis]|uniref:Glycosyltransferase n=1 Tax=Ilex paraguariensis TaxID=185542 RepID=A0ABC8QS73_9AQUA
MASESKLHVVMFPWVAFGHMIPFLELSKVIAQKGHRVSFVSTPKNIQRLPKLPPNFASLINLVKIPLPLVPNLPENAEATMDVRTEDMPYLKKAFDGLEAGLSEFLQNSSADWIIYDFAPHWLPPIAAKLGVSRAFFSIFNAWFISTLGPSVSAMVDGSDPRTAPEHFVVPPEWIPFPTNLAYRHYEINWIRSTININASGFSDTYRLGYVIMGSDAIFIRDCNELEPLWLNLLEELHQKPVIPVGFMPPPAQNYGADKDETWVSIREWLDGKNKSSVVYVALGSEATLSQNDVTELALGLELSGLPFFWALRKPPGSTKSDSVELPQGFLERIKGRGLVWTSWAPQLRILSHDSVGGFLTHCGWSSTIEGLTLGHPLIMLPFLVDQGLNALVLVEKKVGREVQRNEDGSFTRNSVAETLRLVMDFDGEGRAYRNNAKEISEIFKDKNRQDRYLDQFVEYLENQRALLQKT